MGTKVSKTARAAGGLKKEQNDNRNAKGQRVVRVAMAYPHGTRFEWRIADSADATQPAPPGGYKQAPAVKNKKGTLPKKSNGCTLQVAG